MIEYMAVYDVCIDADRIEADVEEEFDLLARGAPYIGMRGVRGKSRRTLAEAQADLVFEVDDTVGGLDRGDLKHMIWEAAASCCDPYHVIRVGSLLHTIVMYEDGKLVVKPLIFPGK